MLYTVIALYEDNLQPYATTVDAETPERAAEIAQVNAEEDNGYEEYSEPLIIAGIIEGRHDVH